MRFLVQLIMLIGLCAPALAVTSAEDAGVTDEATARSYVQKNRDIAMKDGYRLALTACDTDTCVYDQAQTLIAMKGAYEGDYGDQRNLAYCLSRDCGGAIVLKPVLGCAWRMVIAVSGHADVDDGDISNLKLECGKLDAAAFATSKAQARKLFRVVYGSDAPADLN